MLTKEEIIKRRSAIGKTIADMRKERGLSTHQMSALTNLTRANLHKIEYGKAAPTLDSLIKIVDVLGEDIVIQGKYDNETKQV